MEIVILDGYTINPGDLDWSALDAFGKVTVYDRTPPAAVVERAATAAAVLTNKTPIRAETMARLPMLRYIGVLATGYDVVAVNEAAMRGITVTNIPDYGTVSVAQAVFSLLLELCAATGAHDRAVHDGAWSRRPDFCFTVEPLSELAGKTLGIVGYGRIGRQVAKIADAFGMRVLTADSLNAKVHAAANCERVPLDLLFSTADAVTLHCPLTPNTVSLVNAERLALMKPTAWLINTARGGLIDEPALAEALHTNRLAGAGLDVLSQEPPDPTNPLLSVPHCIITPHIAWATREARSRLLRCAVENLDAFIAGRTQNVVASPFHG